jgi:hypothetical protein
VLKRVFDRVKWVSLVNAHANVVIFQHLSIDHFFVH